MAGVVCGAIWVAGGVVSSDAASDDDSDLKESSE